MGQARQFAAKLDMYRKVPGDLVEGSKQGSIVSWIALLTIFFLVYKETVDYWTTRLESELILDQRQSENDLIKVTFNLTLLDLRCQYVEVDVVSVLGNNQNVTKFVSKFPIDAKGDTNTLAARNMREHDTKEELLLHDAAVTKSIEDLIESGQQAVSLDETTFKFALRENDLVFVDFFASW
jgi:hypothetical protein